VLPGYRENKGPPETVNISRENRHAAPSPKRERKFWKQSQDDGIELIRAMFWSKTNRKEVSVKKFADNTTGDLKKLISNDAESSLAETVTTEESRPAWNEAELPTGPTAISTYVDVESVEALTMFTTHVEDEIVH